MKIRNIPPHSINTILFSIVAIVVFYFSMNAAWIGDEIFYSFKVTPTFISNSTSYFEPFQEIQDISDLFTSQNNHYMHPTGNGRYVAHLVVQMFLAWFGQPAFAICNALMYVIFIFLLCKLTRQKISDPKVVILAIILIFLSYVTKFVPTTQIGYIWTSVVNLYFLILLFGKDRNNWLIIPLAILSFAAGNGNESFSSGISIALIFYLFSRAKRLSFQKWIMIFFYGLGALTILGASGLRSRLSDSLAPEQDTGILFFIFKTVLENFCCSFTAIFILLAITAWKLLSKRATYHAIFKDNMFFWIAMTGCILSCAVVNNIYLRALLGANLMAIIIILRIIKPTEIKTFWLYIGSLSVVLLWTYQVYYMYGQKQKLDYISRAFDRSKTGVVYVDLWPDALLGAQFCYGKRLELQYETDSLPTARKRLLHMALQAKYHTDKELKVYPTFLEGKDSVELENQTIKIHSGVFLVIVKDGTKPTINIMRGLDFGLFSIPYDTYTPTLTTPIKEGKNWKAYMVYDDMYLISNLDAEIDGKPAHK